MNNRDEIRNLLGGYAAGTLTPAEQKILFDAALEDQELFDALANEQALKEILDDPDSRRYLRAALEETLAPKPEKRGFFQQLSWQWTTAAGLATVAATLAIVTFVGIQKSTAPKSESQPVTEIASAAKPQSPEAPAATAPQPELRTQAPVKKAAPPAPAVADAVTTPMVANEVKARKEEEAAPAPARQPEAIPAAAPPPPPPPPPADAKPSQSASQLYLAQYRQTQLDQQQQQVAAGRAAAFSQMSRVAPGGAAADKAKTATRDRSGEGPSAEQQQIRQQLARNAGIRYEILRRNSQGQFVATRVDTRFEDGDEIVIAVNKNAGGIVSVLRRQDTAAGWQPLPLASQSLFEARTAPLKLTRGTLDLAIVLSAAATTPQAAGTPPQSQRQLSETLGNAVYVVTPGDPDGPVTAQVRIRIN